MTEFYKDVPKKYVANMEFRREVIKFGSSSRNNAHQVWMACARDMLFYINVFGFTYDPRKETNVIPFITWKFQDEALLKICDAITNGYDLGIVKSRDMGASWMCLLVAEWRWHFKERQTFLMVSRKEDYVDKYDDPDSLFWKIDFIHENTPKWLLPVITRNKLIIKNEDMKSTISGDSTTGDVGRGGRRTAIFLDEFASVENGREVEAATADNTNCRIFNSTPKGTGNAFYDLIRSERAVLKLHWTMHPEKSKGMYIDPDTNKPRSPWYDGQFKRRTKQEVAQELDCDFLGSAYQYFDQNVLDDLERKFCRPPNFSGEATFDKTTLTFNGFVPASNGRLHLWIPVTNGQVDPDEFVFGIDIASGTGASNSVISIGSRSKREKVGEFVTPNVAPHDLAVMALILSKMFKNKDGAGPFMIWEANGPGRIFGNRIIELGYRSIYYKHKEGKLVSRATDIPGWFNTPDTGPVLLSDYRHALAEGEFINHSKESIMECREYIWSPDGGVHHARANTNVDPSGARANHGDRVIGDALLYRGFVECGLMVVVEEKVIPVGSLQWRRDRIEKERLAKSADW